MRSVLKVLAIFVVIAMMSVVFVGCNHGNGYEVNGDELNGYENGNGDVIEPVDNVDVGDVETDTVVNPDDDVVGENPGDDDMEDVSDVEEDDGDND